MFGTVFHVAYMTNDIEKAIALYETVFNGQVLQRGNSQDGGIIAWLKVGESEVELIQPGDLAKLESKTGLIIDHVAYSVPDFDAAVAELEKKGVTFSNRVNNPNTGYRAAFMDSADTLGAVIHLSSR